LRSIVSLQRTGVNASARRSFARLASEIFLSSLQWASHDFYLTDNI
jgi:hypothetical protein